MFRFSVYDGICLHMRKMASKGRRAINVVWENWKRTEIRSIKELLFDGCDSQSRMLSWNLYFYEEIWRWMDWIILERIQGRYVKMVLGVNVNAPNYMWDMEAWRNKLEINNFLRTGKYLMEIGVICSGKRTGERWKRE